MRQNILILLALVLTLTIIVAGCVAPSTGTLVIKVTDKIVGMNHLYITFSEIKIHKANETQPWITITNKSQTIDLFAIRNLTSTIGQKNLKPGNYTQIRIKVEKASATINGKDQTLEIPGWEEQYVKIVREFNIE
ncbi:MAG: DUF4382 domain-containing protein, partial [Euryarchaeota archaeon]|nr:DUF4382 domain-containing protein [Euryarchaeota archaeon]